MPVSIIEKLDRIRKNFLWDRNGEKKMTILLRQRSGPIDEGGLGMTNMGIKNWTLLVKQQWRFAKEEDMLWGENYIF